MRIIGGQYGGRTFNVKIQSETRPTSNFAKEALFNMLSNKIDYTEACVLDLFAGIGSVGFEFASLGAKSVVMVDNSYYAIQNLKQIKMALHSDDIYIKKGDVFKFLAHHNAQYNIVFADPPYSFDSYERLVCNIFDQSILYPGGILVIEHYKKNDLSHLPRFLEVRNYGDSSFSFFIQ